MLMPQTSAKTTAQIATDLLATAYVDIATKEQRTQMVQELYGPQFQAYKVCYFTDIDNYSAITADPIHCHTARLESSVTRVSSVCPEVYEENVFSHVGQEDLRTSYYTPCSLGLHVCLLGSRPSRNY